MVVSFSFSSKWSCNNIYILPSGNDAVLEDDEMLLLSLDRGVTVLHVFIVFVSCLELLTAFWADTEDESIAAAVRPASVVTGFVAGGNHNCPFGTALLARF